MVFTKPCPPRLWLFSAFLPAAIVSLLLSTVVLSSGILLSLSWHLPVRMGLVFVSAQTFAVSLGLIAYLMLLGTIMHPALAAIVALIFNADLFYEFQVWSQGAIRSGYNNWALHALGHVDAGHVQHQRAYIHGLSATILARNQRLGAGHGSPKYE